MTGILASSTTSMARSVACATGRTTFLVARSTNIRSLNPHVARCLLYTCRRNSCGRSARTDGEQSILLSAQGFWGSRHLWKRASINTFRCLMGCTLGDFSAMWFMQANCPDISMSLVMAISMVSGLTSSMLLETILLRLGRDKLTWLAAAKTAAGMSLVSMLGMETVQNLVDYHLTGGCVALNDPSFWAAAAASAAAGFLAPLPYNYSRLKKYGKSCH
ncbi:hypothetical protein VTO42DRAFT_995 [Malbranchea cinnamomea]